MAGQWRRVVVSWREKRLRTMEASGPAAQAQPHACLVFCVSLMGRGGRRRRRRSGCGRRRPIRPALPPRLRLTSTRGPRPAGRRAACSALAAGSGSPRPQIHRRPSCRPCPLAQQHIGITVRKPPQRVSVDERGPGRRRRELLGPSETLPPWRTMH